jgi:hypothetical protein
MMKALSAEKALIYRIAHIRNLPWMLQNGLWSRNSDQRDPAFQRIGNADLIERRRHRTVPIPPGGTLADYVPFYFTPHSMMLYNIKTGYNGVPKLPNEEIVILVSSLRTLKEQGIPFIFTDVHAYANVAQFFDDLDDLREIDWDLLNARDFTNDPEDPGKQERYQAEALVHRHLPLAGLLGIGCASIPAQSRVAADLQRAASSLKVVVRPNWYF